MTAPWKRASVPGGMGTQLDRIRKLELGRVDMTQSGDEIYPFDYSSIGRFMVPADGGTGPNVIGYNDGAFTELTQQAVWMIQVNVTVTGAWTGAGSTPAYLLQLTEYASLHGSVTGVFSSPANRPPIGSGLCYDASTGLSEHIFFRASDLVCTSAGGFTCIEAVLSDGSLVGPGNPYVWAPGDSIMGGYLYFYLYIDEELPQP